jgi:NADH:ubiquinone oxidoreductase subunit 5 (subunit L)/multisubunit Na+/H+ antiporter MnhA subunit
MCLETLLIGCLFWPLFGAFVSGFCGNYLGSKYASYFAVFGLLMSFFLAVYALFCVGFQHSVVTISLFTCFQVPVFVLDNFYASAPFYKVTWALLFDSLTSVMLIVVTSVSSLVHLYATSYMEADPHKSRFFSCLSLFTFFMLMLVTAENYFQLFVGWEGVGLCSYLLITFWYTRLQANKSALQAVVVNKVGDLTLVFALLLIFLVYHDTSFEHVFSFSSLQLLSLNFYLSYWSCSLGEIIGFFFLLVPLPNLHKLAYILGCYRPWKVLPQFLHYCMQPPWLPPVSF